MRRFPTPDHLAYAWHRQAISDLSLGLPLDVNLTPECGWFKRRLVRKGPFVPARIWLDREIDPATGQLLSDEVMCCEVNMIAHDPDEQWLWLCANPIPRAEYDYMVAVARHCAWYEPDQPQAQPRRPVDWMKTRLPTF